MKHVIALNISDVSGLKAGESDTYRKSNDKSHYVDIYCSSTSASVYTKPVYSFSIRMWNISSGKSISYHYEDELEEMGLINGQLILHQYNKNIKQRRNTENYIVNPLFSLDMLSDKTSCKFDFLNAIAFITDTSKK